MNTIIKYSSSICACMLCAAIFKLPLPYYDFLRVVVSIGAVFSVVRSSTQKEYLWAAIFLIIAILFNPFIPIYLYQKFKWIWIDLLVALLFLKDFHQPKPKEEQKDTHKQIVRRYHRDKIY